MQQPTEYKSLTSKGFFIRKPAFPEATEFLLLSAQDHLTATHQLICARLPTPALTTAYQGLSQLFRAVFEFREVLPVEGCWSTATLVVCRDLGMHVAEQCLINALHEKLEPTSDSSSYPCRSLDEVRDVAGLLEKYLPVAAHLMRLDLPSTSPPMNYVEVVGDTYTKDHMGASATCSS